MERREALAASWRELVKSEAAIASVVEVEPGILSWVDHDAMLALHIEAADLRNLDDDEGWKAPFNTFRQAFLHRDIAELRELAGSF